MAAATAIKTKRIDIMRPLLNSSHANGTGLARDLAHSGDGCCGIGCAEDGISRHHSIRARPDNISEIIHCYTAIDFDCKIQSPVATNAVELADFAQRIG